MNPSSNESHKTSPNKDDRFSSVKSTLETCMGFMDGLCCASLNQVSAEDRQEKSRAHLRDFMTSYDLGYLNSNYFGDAQSTTASSNNTPSSSNNNNTVEKKDSMNSPSCESPKFPSVEKGTTRSQSTTSASAIMHTILPNSMLPRDYGVSPRSIREDPLDETSSCCHSMPRFHGLDYDYPSCQPNSSTYYPQPNTLQSADTYTTVSLTQSYSTAMWDDEDDDEEGISEDYILSPVDSVFRKDEHMEEAAIERDGPESCSSSSPFAPSSIATKTHEAYQYLLRMKSDNYLHGSGSSSEDLEYCDGEELRESYCQSSTNNNTIFSRNSSQCGSLFLQ